MDDTRYTETFNYQLLISLSNWQNGWYENQNKRREIADRLMEQCRSLPKKFRTCNIPCFRKRFLVKGEIVPVLMEDEYFEGIASWSTNLEFAKGFKGYIKPATEFAMVFKHTPTDDEVLVNFPALWENTDFVSAAERFREEKPTEAQALFHFRDNQAEVVLRSTLKGTEIEDIVAVSSSFDELCDKAGIPEEKRRETWIQYHKNPEGIPIELPSFIGSGATKSAVKQVIEMFKKRIKYAEEHNIPINWGNTNENKGLDSKYKS
jgi:hypothetical protein